MKTTILDNGLKIITDETDGDFVTASYFVNKGSIDEKESTLGIAHLAEHMVFKGTTTRDKNEIWEFVQRNGGELNAYTSTNSTCFHCAFMNCTSLSALTLTNSITRIQKNSFGNCTSLKEFGFDAVEIVSDLVWNNTIPQEEFELEKSVVIEELKMYHDDAEHRVYDLATKTLFNKYKNRWSNGGTPETVSKITRDDMIEYINRVFVPKNITVCVTGNIKHEEVVDYISSYIEGYEFSDSNENYRDVVDELNLVDGFETIDGTQSTMFAVLETKINSERELMINAILSKILGGGFGSRMMPIREVYGYAYTVYSNYEFNSYDDKAYCFVYAGLNKDNIEVTKQLIADNLDKFISDGITEAEFNQAIVRNISSLKKKKCFCEDLNDFKLSQLSFGGSLSVDDLIEILETLTLEEVNEYIKNVFSNHKVVYMVVEQKQ